MSHDPHFGYIIAAYALALVIVASMAASLLADYLRLKRALAAFDHQEPASQDETSSAPDKEL
ncbi:MAG TPA: heme exporter protein CcmD [Methylocella sp.]|nr:heme exporter protein CcmD [Methylocella sp.]